MRIVSDWFSARKIEQSGQCFRWERLPDGSFRVPAFETVLHLRQLSEQEIYLDCTESDFRDLWQDYFDLGFDYRRFTETAVLRIGSPYLAAAAQSARGIRILRQELWETVVSFIISANNNIPRIKKILSALCETCGGFPNPQKLYALDTDTLRRCGTGYRDKYLHGAAEFFLERSPLTLLSGSSYAEAALYLQQLPGVGPKVADCICLFGLGCKDAFPRDVWVKRIEQEHFGGCFPVDKAPEAAGVLQQYLFYHERAMQGLCPDEF
ncbi:MAG: 8-oxoguanine DNA glycosylase [Ruminococcus sp.]|nr:8-oxoguanine DNA glycosylase [Ruminococcus sp.]